MKRLIVAMMLLALLLTKSVSAFETNAVYLPLIISPRISTIDCMDAYGRLMECP